MTEILLTSGYTDIADVHDGDQCVAYDISGNPVTNTIENIDEWRNVDGQIWAWTKETGAEIGPQGGVWKWLLVNGTATLFAAQSIWRMPAGGAILANPINVCHASDLEVGDTYYDGSDNPVVITSIADTTGPDVWYRFDVSGDHGYIADDVSLHNASRFWVGNGGTWDLSATTHWASSTGGSSGTSAPGSADTVTIDASSGTGTVTPNYGGTGTFQSIACGAMGMTLDYSVNNDAVTLTATAGFTGSGSGVRTIRLGNNTWTISATANNATVFNIGTTTNLTFAANSSTLEFSGAVAFGVGQTLSTGGQNLNTVMVSGARHDSGLTITGGGTVALLTNTAAAYISFGSTATITTLTQSAQLSLGFGGGTTITFTNAPTIMGTISAPCSVFNTTASAVGASATVNCTSGTFSGSYCSVAGCTFSGGAIFSFTNSWDLGKNTGATITAPAAGGGSGNSGGYIIGS